MLIIIIIRWPLHKYNTTHLRRTHIVMCKYSPISKKSIMVNCNNNVQKRSKGAQGVL